MNEHMSELALYLLEARAEVLALCQRDVVGDDANLFADGLSMATLELVEGLMEEGWREGLTSAEQDDNVFKSVDKVHRWVRRLEQALRPMLPDGVMRRTIGTALHKLGSAAQDAADYEQESK